MWNMGKMINISVPKPYDWGYYKHWTQGPWEDPKTEGSSAVSHPSFWGVKSPQGQEFENLWDPGSPTFGLPNILESLR